MSNYRMERGWMEHPVFGLFEAGIPKRPLTEHEAFIWLIENAAWKKITINILGKPVDLERGQLSFSYRFMSDKTGWGINRYKGWLKRLETWGILSLKTDTAQSIITICNYSKYQDVTKKTDTHPDTGSDTHPDTHPDTKKKETIKEVERSRKKEVEGASAFPPPEFNLEIPPALQPEKFFLPDWIEPADWADFAEMRRKQKKPMTDRAAKAIIKKLQTYRSQGHDPATILEQSIRNAWQDVYEPKTDYKSGGGSRQNEKPCRIDSVKNAADLALASLRRDREAELDAGRAGMFGREAGENFGGEFSGQPQIEK